MLRNPFRRLRQVLDMLGLPVTSTRGPFHARTPMKLVALPKPSTPPPDLLREAAREYVRAFGDYVAGWERRFDGRRHRWRRGRFSSNFIVPLKLARDGYYEQASTSSDPLHRQVATLLESGAVPGYVTNDGPAVRILQNWLRDEPRLETYPAESWVASIAPRVEFARALKTGSYTVTLSLEMKRRLLQPAVLCVDVGTDVASASVSLVTRRKAHVGKTEVIWKESRIWVMLGESRLEEGDLVNITVSGARPVNQPATVRIATLARGSVSAAPG